MSFGVEYILRARDMLSGTLQNAGRQATIVQRNITNANRATDKAGIQAQGRIQQLGTRLQYLQQRQAGAFDERHIGRYNTAIRKTQAELERLRNLPPRSFIQRIREANGSADSLAGKLKGVVAIAGLIRGATGIIKLGADLEQSQVGFEVLLGNAQKAKQMLDGINQFAKVTPFEPEGLIENAKLMLSFGTSAEKILPNLKMIGDIAMGDAKKMDSLTLAFSQMSSVGKLQGQDLLQMINAGFNPLQELSKMSGKSMATLRKEMEKGSISVEMVESAFKHATSDGGQFFGMMERMSQSTSGKLSTLTGSFKQVGAEIGLKILPYVNSLLEFLMPLAEWIGRNADMILIITGIALGAVVAFKLVTGAIKLWTIAQAILNGTMMLNPIGLIIAGIAALIAIIVVCYKKFSWFRGIVNGVWDTMKLFWKFLKDAFMNVINGIVDVFSGLGKIIKSLFSGDWEGIKEGAKQAGKGYINAQTGVIRSAVENGSQLVDTFKDGYNRGVEDFNKEKEEEEEEGVSPDSFFGKGGKGKGKEGDGDTDPLGSLNNITSGGSKQTNITINLNKEMVGQISIHPLTMTQGVGEVKDMIMESLAQILNSANRIAYD